MRQNVHRSSIELGYNDKKMTDIEYQKQSSNDGQIKGESPYK